MADQVMVVADSGYDTSGGGAPSQARDLVSRARRNFHTVIAAESPLRDLQLDDLRFSASEQWDQLSIADRDQDGRPRITINRLRQFIRQVTNGIRDADMSVQIIPQGDGASVETAQVFEGLVRHIQAMSDADVAYDTANDHQVTIGRGYWRIVAEYSDDQSFTQDLKIKRIRNPFTVYMDPASIEVDGSDARFCLVVEDIPKDEFEARFPDASPSSLSDISSLGDESPDWMPEGKIRVAEYWYTDYETVPLLLVEILNPITKQHEQFSMSEAEYADMPDMLRMYARIVRTRDVMQKRIKMALINGVEILQGNADKTDGAEWPGDRIPIVPLLGEEIDINGRVDYRGMVRDAKDPQRIYNYENTALVETLALAPLSQWVGFEGQFEGHEAKWNQANRRRFPYLEVKPISIDGTSVTLPQRITAEPAIAGIIESIHQSDNDLKATMGLYDPSLGVRGPQQSGKAISALQQQGEQANSNFMDNMRRSLRATGRILLNLIPKYYDAPRVVRIVNPDGAEQTVMVHAGAPPESLPPAGQLPPGVSGIYDLNVGKYDVTVDVGPSAPTKRKAAAESLTQFVQAFPSVFPVIGDILVKNMDFPGAQQLSARLAKMVPPQFQDQPAGGPPALPPQAAQQIQQLQQQLEQLAQANTQLTDKLRTEGIKAETQLAMKQLEVSSDEKLKLLDIGAKIIMAEATAKSSRTDALAASETNRINSLLDNTHERMMQAAEHAHDVGMASHAIQSGNPTATVPPPMPSGGEPPTGGAAPAAAAAPPPPSPASPASPAGPSSPPSGLPGSEPPA